MTELERDSMMLLERFGFIAVGADLPQRIGAYLTTFNNREGEMLSSPLVIVGECSEAEAHAQDRVIAPTEEPRVHLFYYKAVAE